MLLARTCVQCGKAFEAQRQSAQFCSASCRAMKSQGYAPKAAAVAVLPAREPVADGLYGSVLARVTEAGLLDSPEGQAALDLARRLPDANDGSVAGLHRELRAALAVVDALVPRRSSLDELRLRRDRKRAGTA